MRNKTKMLAGILAAVIAALTAGCAQKAEPAREEPSGEPAAELTLPDDAGELKALCLVTSDLHFTLSDVSSVYTLGKYTPELARAFAEEAAGRKPDVVLMCGDNTNSSRAEDLEALTDILAPLQEGGCEVILVTGNHDCGFTEEEFFGCIDRLCSVTERDPASYSYAVVTHGCRFLAMDDNTAVPGGERGKYKEETMEWLKRQLAEAVLGKRYSRAKREEIGKLFAAFMSAYAEGTLADHREAIMGSPNYEDFLEAFAESNYGPWIRYMMETTAEPGNRAVIPLAECT